MSIQRAIQNASPEEIQALKSDPRLWMRSSWRHPNRPKEKYDFYDTNGENYLHYLDHDDGPLNPYNWGSINVLLWGRGCLKTTTLLGIISWAIQFYGPHGWESYMTAPREGQVKEFVDKFTEVAEQTGLSKQRQKNSIGHQKFQFQDGQTPIYSHFKTDTGWGEGDALRGPHCNFGIIDEFQDLPKASFDTFRECIDQEVPGVPFFPAIFAIGTPKMENSFFADIWEKSDQRDWDPERGEWVPQAEAESYGDGDDAMVVRGWHIDQPSCPLHSDAKVEQSKDTYSEQKFHNEVLAEFFSPEDDLLAERHLDAILDHSKGFTRQRQYDDSYVTIGVDWGGGEDRNAADTVMFIGEHYEDTMPRSPYYDGETYDEPVSWTEIRDVKFLDDSLSKQDEFEAVEKAIMAYDADRVIVDEGYASKRREDLQNGTHTINPDGYPDLVIGCRFGNVSDANKVKWKDASEKRLFTCDKTHIVKSVVDDVKSQKIALPANDISPGAYGDQQDTGTKIYNQLTAAYEKKRESTTGRKATTITSDSGRNDDAIDALSYMWIGYHSDTVGPRETFVKFGSHDKPGLSY